MTTRKATANTTANAGVSPLRVEMTIFVGYPGIAESLDGLAGKSV
jgi:hypothetical protein